MEQSRRGFIRLLGGVPLAGLPLLGNQFSSPWGLQGAIRDLRDNRASLSSLRLTFVSALAQSRGLAEETAEARAMIDGRSEFLWSARGARIATSLDAGSGNRQGRRHGQLRRVRRVVGGRHEWKNLSMSPVRRNGTLRHRRHP
jgi:hypothetical protein